MDHDLKEYHETSYQIGKAFFFFALGGWLMSLVPLVLFLMNPEMPVKSLLMGHTVGMGIGTVAIAFSTWRAKHQRDMAS